MASAHPHNEFATFGDELWNIAFASEGQNTVQRTERLQQSSHIIGRMLLTDWEGDDTQNHNMLYNATMLACVPSIATLAASKKHSLAVAEQVSGNLQLLDRHIMDRKLDRTGNPHLVGKISEISVLSLLWWGIANGYLSEDSYALLTDSRHDRGTLLGMRNGVDIVLRMNSTKSGKRPIQVKTSLPSRGTINSYKPGIAVISPVELVSSRRGSSAAGQLLEAVANNDLPVLRPAFETVITKVDKAHQEEKSYRVSLRKTA